jgi:Tfp pilus assembly protein PilO
MKQNSKATMNSKRDKISQANSTVFVAVAIAAVVVMFSLISLRFLWIQKAYNDRVIGAKTSARAAINSNLQSLDSLSNQYPEIRDRSSNNAKTILHALPPTYDYAALVTSMEYLAQTSGVRLVGGVGQDQSASAIREQNISQPQEIPLTLSVEGRYESIVRYMNALERSIRPVIVTSIDISGSNSNLQATLQAKTYYQPARTLDVAKEEIQ